MQFFRYALLLTASECLCAPLECTSYMRDQLQRVDDGHSLMQTSLSNVARSGRTHQEVADRDHPIYEWVRTAADWLLTHGIATAQLYGRTSNQGVIHTNGEINTLKGVQPINDETLAKYSALDIGSAVLQRLKELPVVDRAAWDKFQSYGSAPSEDNVLEGLTDLKTRKPDAFEIWSSMAFHWHRVSKTPETKMTAAALANAGLLSLVDVNIGPMEIAQSSMRDIIKVTIENPRTFFGQSADNWLQAAVDYLDENLQHEKMWCISGDADAVSFALNSPVFSSELCDEKPDCVATAAGKIIKEISPIDPVTFQKLDVLGKKVIDGQMLKEIMLELQGENPTSYKALKLLTAHWHRLSYGDDSIHMEASVIASCTYRNLASSMAGTPGKAQSLKKSNIQKIIKMLIEDPDIYFE